MADDDRQPPPPRGPRPKRPGGYPRKMGGKGAGKGAGKGGGAGGGRPGPRARRADLAPDIAILYGWHPVREALANPLRRFRRLVVTENALNRLLGDDLPIPVEPETVRPDAIDRLLSPDAVHQGFYAEVDPLEAPPFEKLGEKDLLIVLDQVTDPHNVGAILRTAAAFGVAALVTTHRHAPEATGVLAKAASGGLEHVPIMSVTNLARAIAAMKGEGVTVIGLDSEGTADLADMPLPSPLALVLGAEGKGLRQLTRDSCDAVARLDLPGAIKSLNVSNAAALALYIASRKLGR